MKREEDRDGAGEMSSDDEAAPTPRTLTVDVAYYARLLDDPNVTDEQREEFIKSLWGVILCFVDFGYRLSPVQQVGAGAHEALDAAVIAKLCGEDPDGGNDPSSGTPSVLGLGSPQTAFKRATGRPSDRPSERCP